MKKRISETGEINNEGWRSTSTVLYSAEDMERIKRIKEKLGKGTD